ncbi:MAG: hypothetical protein ACYCZF_03815 [Anaerolineae bacterium]
MDSRLHGNDDPGSRMDSRLHGNDVEAGGEAAVSVSSEDMAAMPGGMRRLAFCVMMGLAPWEAKHEHPLLRR